MSAKTTADIIAIVRDDLGTPDPVTELKDSTITRWITDSIRTFNRLVGKVGTRVLSSSMNVQTYNLSTLFSPAEIIKVRKIITDPVIENKIVGATSETAPSDITSIDTASQVSSAEDIDIIYEAPLLTIIPAPATDGKKYILLTQEPYTLADIPEDYFDIVLKHIKAQCEYIVVRTRLRLATPMRQGDFIMGYGKKEELLSKDADKILADFEKECADIALIRMV